MELMDAIDYGTKLLDKYDLTNWSMNVGVTRKYFGYCEYKTKCIFISNWHCKINTDYEVKRTIIHEIAHALLQGHGHDSIWKRKFESLLNIELGIDERITTRFGKGKAASKADIAAMNTFKLKL